MDKLRYAALVALAADYETATVTLSPFSIALIASLLQEPCKVFVWSELTPEQKDDAEQFIAQALAELG